MTNHDELCEKDKEIKELRTRVAELEKELENDNSEVCRQRDMADSERRNAEIRCTNLRMENDVRKEREDKLQTRLSTLLKASEGMEKALEKIHRKAFDDDFKWINVKDVAQSALADFRAVKEIK